MFGRVMSRVYQACDWVMKLAIANLLWIIFTLLGLVAFGISPATSALFAVIRKWVRGEAEIPVFKTFWSYYRRDFFKSNGLGLLFFVSGYILYIDFQFALHFEGASRLVLLAVVVIVGSAYVLTIAYLFPVFVHFELPGIKHYIKNAFLIGVSQLPSTLLMIGGIFLSYLIFRVAPGTLIFYCASLLSYFIYWSANRAFIKIERKKKGANVQ